MNSITLYEAMEAIDLILTETTYEADDVVTELSNPIADEITFKKLSKEWDDELKKKENMDINKVRVLHDKVRKLEPTIHQRRLNVGTASTIVSASTLIALNKKVKELKKELKDEMAKEEPNEEKIKEIKTNIKKLNAARLLAAGATGASAVISNRARVDRNDAIGHNRYCDRVRAEKTGIKIKNNEKLINKLES